MTVPPTSTNDIRQAYLNFFVTQKHKVIAGASLIPENDPTVLFTTAGMHPLVPYLMGEKHPSGTRLVDVQRCVRTGDIEEVGDDTHLTCFEMLGNWSLGDYFKKESIEMSYTFLTQELHIDPKYLAVTCFAGDDDAPKDEEASQIWQDVGMPTDRIAFLPKSENWWGPAGQTGPCGPDTEIFYWVGEGEPHGNPGINEDDWMEIWNNVFMQYNKKEDGTFEPLAQQNVDTGMGLERTAAMLQKVSNVYEIDILQPIIQYILQLASTEDDAIRVRHARIITDHIKAAVLIIADGITPSNVDQGYVLRRLIRRAIRSARALGIEHSGSCTPDIAKIVLEQYAAAYPSLPQQSDHILKTLEQEEVQFAKALQEGLKQFSKLLEETPGDTLAGESAFHLYDTYGFPIEMTEELVQEHGKKVDTAGFDAAFAEHQVKSRAGAEKKFSGGLADHSVETTKLHTATHLLNAALRAVLGDHISQKGSNITAERLRFDFNYDQKLTPEQLEQVSAIVNGFIQADFPITYHLTTPEKAKEEQAIGVFNDRYGNEVKVYTMGDGTKIASKEICGGPHVASTGQLGTFTIRKEESSSAGVRRIKATVQGGPEEITFAPEA